MYNSYFTKAKSVKAIIEEEGDKLIYSAHLTDDGNVYSERALGFTYSAGMCPTRLSDLNENENILFYVEVHPRYEISVNGIAVCWVNNLAGIELSYGNVSVFDRLKDRFIK